MADETERPYTVTLSGDEMHVVLRAVAADASVWTPGNEQEHLLFGRLWEVAKEGSREDEVRLIGRAMQEVDHFRMERQRTLKRRRDMRRAEWDRYSDAAAAAAGCKVKISQFGPITGGR